MQRVMIYGGSGSGKSTLARDIGKITGLPVVHIDPMYYRAGWQQRPKQEITALVLDAMSVDQWVLDGNHHGTFPKRIDRADTVIFLDFPTWLRIWRVIIRTWRYHGKTRPDMAKDCPERFDGEFIFTWVGGYYRRSFAQDLAIFEALPAEKHAVRLRSSRQVKSFLKTLVP